jgi:DNA polymerase V
MKNIFALVDCNNFYVSCERVFAPAYDNKPVVVLSNNDGCIISRSREAKALGIKMGEPYFKCEKTLKEHGVKVFSSNYALYGDFSRRVIDTLRQFSPDIEIYSIDEAFLLLDGIDQGPDRPYASLIKDTVKKWTGIPVSVGIAGTKTLAKIANERAKHDASLSGVLDLTQMDEVKVDELLRATDIEDVWGIGFRYAHFLRKNRIDTAYALKKADTRWVRRHMTVVGERTALELAGVSCLSLEKAPDPKKQIVSSRSFGKPVSTLNEMNEALSYYVTRAAEKLRRQGSVASAVQVFLTTGNFGKDAYFNTASGRLPAPSADTSSFIRMSKALMEGIFRKGLSYKKCGVIISDITSGTGAETDLFAGNYRNSKKEDLVIAMDSINKKWERDTVSFASSGTKKEWMMRRGFLSGRFTTCWEEIPVARA